MATKQTKPTFKEALIASLWDSVNVVFYSGVPATGVIVLVNTMSQDFPDIVKYAPYIATAINVIAFYIKRVLDYLNGKRELPDFMN